jgi:hypothetical protein
MRSSNTVLLAVVLLAGTASAQTFADRVAAAKTQSTKPEGQRYEQSLYPTFGEGMRTCIPPGTIGTETLGNFTLVGTVTSGGSLRNAAVEPESKVALCFREQMRAACLPAPPYVLASPAGAGYPIVIEMKVTP